ncbi:MAG: DUF4129 domain-containing protein [Bacillota bacterium]
MNALIDGVLSALAEAVVLGRIALAGVAHIDLPNIATWVFCLAAAAHAAGNMAARASGAKALGAGASMAGASKAVVSGDGGPSGNRLVLLALWLGPMFLLGYVSVRAYSLLGFGGILTTMLTWIVASSRGIAAATHPAESESARRGLVWGTAALGFMSLVRLRGGSPGTAEILAFLLLSTALLVLRRRQEVVQNVPSQAGAPWAAGGAVFAATVLASVLIVYAIGSGGFGTVVRVLAAVRDFVSVALGYIILPLAYLVEWLILRMRRAIEGYELETQKMPSSLGDELTKQLRESQELAEVPAWLKWGGLVLVIAATIGLAWFLVSRFYRRSQQQVASETRESLVEGGALREWWGSVAEGIRGFAAGALSGLRSLVGWEPQTLEGVYAATLALLGKRGLPREMHVTPYEYRCSVRDHMPDEAAKRALDTITEVFSECYYSEREPDESEMKLVMDAYKLLLATPFQSTPGDPSST